VDVIGKNQSA